MTSEAPHSTPPWSALVIDDDAGIRQSLRLCLEAMGAQVLGVGSPAAAIDALERATYDVIFLDLWLGQASGLDLLPKIRTRQPSAGIIVVTAFASYDTAVQAMRQGATDYLPKPFTPDQVRVATRRVLETQRLQREVRALRAQVDAQQPDASPWLQTRDPNLRSLLDQARRVAPTDATVLLRGDSGTGKNVFARWLHHQSARADKPLVLVHCPALTNDLMSSALFGHRKGAFTGATEDVVGKVEEAQRGTLLLDEIGDLSADAQARLLRFLHDRTYERLGDPQERRADVRVIAATNRPLEDLVEQGTFREDLLYRINVFTLELPPLRERREDILPLVRHHLSMLWPHRREGPAPVDLSETTQAALLRHPWPGNLRELRNAVERATILGSPPLQPQDFGLTAPEGAGEAASPRIGDQVSLQEIEREHIARIIATSPTLEAAARVLGIDATTLQRKRRRYGLV